MMSCFQFRRSISRARVGLACVIGLAALAVGCVGWPRGSTEKPISYSRDFFLPVTFIEHSAPGTMQSYLAMNLPYRPVEELRRSVETRLGVELKNRGEAHVTVITPVEFDQALSKKMNMDRIHAIVRDFQIQQSPYEPLCLGRGSANLDGRGEQTYYVVLRAPRLFEIRRAVRDAFVQAGGDAAAFDPERFFPHVTLGFTKRDLHEADGVIKDARSCWIPLEQATP